MSRMDFNRHYATVIGEPGVAYQQDNRWFHRDGSPVEVEPIEPVEQPEPVDGRIRNNGWTEDDLRRPENKALKAQLDLYDEPWTTRKAALEFINKGRG
jgi:hypothetical protein